MRCLWATLLLLSLLTPLPTVAAGQAPTPSDPTPLPAVAAGQLITSSHVFAQAVRIEGEVELLKAHLGLRETKPAVAVHAPLLPRHAWQKAYLIQLKINIFRRQHGFSVEAANTLEQVRDLEPIVVHEQTQRILTQIAMLKLRLGISAEVAAPEVVPDKQPVDVFNKLHQVSLQWDVLNRGEVQPADVYGEVKRLNEDVNTILQHLRVWDVAHPPAKIPGAQSNAALEAAFEVLGEVQRLQQRAAIPRVDLGVFRKGEGVLPSDVLNMVVLVLAEVQTVKAHLGLNHDLTPVHEKHSAKTPAEVAQFLGYVANKLRLIRSL